MYYEAIYFNKAPCVNASACHRQFLYTTKSSNHHLQSCPKIPAIFGPVWHVSGAKSGVLGKILSEVQDDEVDTEIFSYSLSGPLAK